MTFTWHRIRIVFTTFLALLVAGTAGAVKDDQSPDLLYISLGKDKKVFL